MKKRNLTIFTILIAFLSLSVLFTPGCKQEDKEKEPKVIKIGAILPLTGNLAIIGQPKKNAIDIAIEELNLSPRNKDIKFEILYKDSEGNPKDGVNAFQNLLTQENIKYFYIDLTTIVNSCVPIVDKEEVLTFAGSAEPEITNLSKWLFRVFAGGEQEIEMIVNYLKKNKFMNVYVYHTNEIYGNNAFKYFKKSFEQIGGKIAGVDEYSFATKDFKDILIKAMEAKGDKIVILGYGIKFTSILTNAKQLNIPNEDIVMNLGATNSAVVKLDPEYTNGITFVGPRFTYLLENDLLKEEMLYFVNKYKEKFSDVPDFRAAYAYDVINILSHVWERIDYNDITAVSSEIRKLKKYAGASGEISFKENGDSDTDLVLAQFQNGKMILIDQTKEEK